MKDPFVELSSFFSLPPDLSLALKKYPKCPDCFPLTLTRMRLNHTLSVNAVPFPPPFFYFLHPPLAMLFSAFLIGLFFLRFASWAPYELFVECYCRVTHGFLYFSFFFFLSWTPWEEALSYRLSFAFFYAKALSFYWRSFLFGKRGFTSVSFPPPDTSCDIAGFASSFTFRTLFPWVFWHGTTAFMSCSFLPLDVFFPYPCLSFTFSVAFPVGGSSRTGSPFRSDRLRGSFLKDGFPFSLFVEHVSFLFSFYSPFPSSLWSEIPLSSSFLRCVSDPVNKPFWDRDRLSTPALFLQTKAFKTPCYGCVSVPISFFRPKLCSLPILFTPLSLWRWRSLVLLAFLFRPWKRQRYELPLRRPRTLCPRS